VQVLNQRPRVLRWYHAGAMLFGDWGTSRLYVLGLAFFFCGQASIYYMLAMSLLLIALAWAYELICRKFPDGGGVYSAAVEQSRPLAVLGGLLLCADYVVTAGMSAVAAFHYLKVPQPHLWAAVGIGVIGILNVFGPIRAGTFAVIAAIVTVACTTVIALFTVPALTGAIVVAPSGPMSDSWSNFAAIVLAISGVEAIANMTGIMVLPVERTVRRSIWPVVAEIVCLNLVLTLAMQAIPLAVLGNGDPSQAFVTHRDDMLDVIARHYVGPAFAGFASIVFAVLLLSAVNTAVSNLVSIQYRMAHDRELPAPILSLNRWGMPPAALALAVAVPVVTVLLSPDTVTLARLYALSVSSMIALNLAVCALKKNLDLPSWQRAGLLGLAVLLALIAGTVGYENPTASLFVLLIVGAGFFARWFAQHRAAVGQWMLAEGDFPLRVPLSREQREPTAAPHTDVPTASATRRSRRILVATEGNSGPLQFAVEQAAQIEAELIVLYVRHVAVDAPAPTEEQPTIERDALRTQASVEQLAAAASVPIRFLYVEARDVGGTVLDVAIREGVEMLLLGSARRSGIWKALKGDVIQTVADGLPPSIRLVVQA
jgi:nucleotide-binding universal stress UspA family protein